MKRRYTITEWLAGTFRVTGQQRFWTRAGALRAGGRLAVRTDAYEYTITDHRAGKTTPL